MQTPCGTDYSSSKELKGMPFPLLCTFYYNGVPITVTDPQVELLSYDDNNVVAFRSLDCLPVSSGSTAFRLNSVAGSTTIYSIMVDPLSFPPGVYKVVFSGKMSNTQATIIQIQGVIGVQELSRLERILVSSLASLMDNPEEYLFKPQVHQFKAYNMYSYLENGLQFINVQPPYQTDYILETLPVDYENFLVDYIVANAMFGKARLGIENDFNIADSRSLQVETYSKYKGLYDSKMTFLTASLKGAKSMLRPSPRGFMRSRYPRLMQRILSLTPYYSNMFMNI